MKKAAVIIIIAVVILAAGGYIAKTQKNSGGEPEYKTVAVTRGNIIEKALAVGKIEPKKEIAIKSKISGIVSRVYVDMGDIVKKGQPLFEISPDPTPYEYADMKMDVEMKRVRYETAERNFKRTEALLEQNLIAKDQIETPRRERDESKLELELAQERLSLMEKGKMKIANRDVENVVRAPVTGMILERKVNEGDPVVPLTSYQAGTELMMMADMENLIFMGTVDEIDVGKLYEGMPASITIGALPNASIQGKIKTIAPKAKVENNATLFDVEITVNPEDTIVLRAGYSANANLIIERKDSVLMIPERLVTFSGDTAKVEVEEAIGKVADKQVELGISDGINIEVVSGLELDEKVVERPPKKIE